LHYLVAPIVSHYPSSATTRVRKNPNGSRTSLARRCRYTTASEALPCCGRYPGRAEGAGAYHLNDDRVRCSVDDDHAG
jgi:hypothetical protein